MDKLVDFSYGDIVKIRSDRLDECKKYAKENKNKKRYRICLHESPENKLQEMIICRSNKDYSRPAKHVNCPETHTIIDGRMAVVLFEDDGMIKDVIILDRENGYLSCRINAEIYHMLIPLTDTAITYETKIGPFTPEMNIFPDWAPSEDDISNVNDYMITIKNHIFKYL